MTKKDLTILKKAICKVEETTIRQTASCYVDKIKNVLRYQDPILFSRYEEKEALQYLAFIKKGMPSGFGVTAIEIPVNDPPIRSLTGDTMADIKNIEPICEAMVRALPLEDPARFYFASGDMDVRASAESGEEDSEEVYRYAICMVQPCRMNKPGIIYDYPQNEFMGAQNNLLLDPPIITFLYPSFDNGHVDDAHAMCFLKKAKQRTLYQELCVTLLGNEMPIDADTQKAEFYSILSAGFDSQLPMEAAQNIYEKLDEIRAEAVNNGEEAVLSAREIARIAVQECEMDESSAEAVYQEAEKYPHDKFSMENIAPKSVDIKTDKVRIKVEMQALPFIQTVEKNGLKYLLVPAENTQINEMPVRA